MPSCKFCNKPLVWTQPYKKGDRPCEKNGTPHNCPNYKPKRGCDDTQQYSKWVKTTKDDWERCPHCKGTNYGYCRKGTDELEKHIKTFHPNGEVGYDDDFMAIDRNKPPKDFMVHRPCYKCNIFILIKWEDVQGKTTFLCETCA
mgnify:CR=1 FL=1